MTTLVVSNVIAVKLVEIEGRIFPAGLVIFPLAYVLGDVLTEVYGFRAARQVIWLDRGNLLAVGAIQIAIRLPAAGFYVLDEAYADVLGTTWRLFLASLGRLPRRRASELGRAGPDEGRDRRAVPLGAHDRLDDRRRGPRLGDLRDARLRGDWSAAPRPDPDDMGDQGRLQVTAHTTYVIVNRLKRAEGVDAFDRDTRFNPLPVGR